MNGFTLDDLREIMRASVGVDAEVDLDGEIADVEFAELGYDSLAVMELAGQVRRRLGVSISDDDALRITTPGKAVDYVNGKLAEAAY
ncbi:actinorhodin polyketide synthase [Actinosynnema sp. ALI-1.44]|uniref:acyl carrier protein n=1 Tax=Actinosynnema sp. ALI-1.44 TaxID=1933779 RepID=UPI00097CB87A|nr:acyl carrier protein [Actinosynnema sp. ALI-1.44]ONI77889.1 actinorhodin polyketide synthase [Actinosynnema sp. ALI-1.44]